MLQSYLILGLIYLWTAFCIPFTIVGKLLDPAGYLSHRAGRAWSWGEVKISRVKLEIEGLENIETDKQYIFISNHPAAFDLPSVYWGITNKHGMLAKKQLKYVPFFGWAMWAAGHYFVDRHNHRRALAMMDQVALLMSKDKNHSLVIFAEGTRSVDGQLQQFRKGAFVLSLDTGIPIVPIVINGAFKAKKKKGSQIIATTIKLLVLPPMQPNNYSTDTRQQYLKDARDLFVKHYTPPPS